MPVRSHQSSEAQPLLRDSDSPDSYQATATGTPSDESAPKKPLNELSKADLAWVLAGLWSAVFLGALDGTIVATLLTPIGSYFNKSNQASYLGTAYLLSVCCFTPLYGRLSDILGRKGAMLLALTLFGIGTVGCGIAPSMETLIAARAVAGMGGGGVMTVSSIAVTDLIPLKRRGLYQGMANILFGLGAGVGGPVGGFLNDRLGWRSAFLLQIPVLAFSFVLVLLKVSIELPSSVTSQSTSAKLARIDWAGSSTLVGTVGCLLLGFALKSSEELAWSHPLVWGLFIGSAVFGVIFVLVESFYSQAPVMPLHLIRQRTPLSVAVCNFLGSLVAFSTLYNVPLYFSAVRLNSATQAGLHLLPHSVALSLGSIFAGWMMRRTGKLYYLNVSSVALTVLAQVLLSTWNDNTATFQLWFDIVPQGFGMCSMITTTLIAMIATVSREEVAVATGITYLFRTTGQVIGVSLSGTILQAVLTSKLRERIQGPGSLEIIERIRHSTEYIRQLEPGLQRAAVGSYADALRVVFMCQAAVAFLNFLVSLPIEEKPLPGTHEEQEEQYRRNSERRAVGSN